MKRCLLILGLLLAAGCTSSVPLETGVSRTLARSRAGQISDIRYHLAFTVPDSTDQPCRGTVTIHFTQQRRGPVVLGSGVNPGKKRQKRPG